ncbi:MAG: hypothetical protein IIB16_05990 [Chloroflexi bacterium]|nr:hypothetical protein [Chloroflexota bacterium]MCH8869818.1 hypothetical protein [Chloroflexota bacterium]MCI0822776.1 hypothetical protein [Chloroflexota bacterium]
MMVIVGVVRLLVKHVLERPAAFTWWWSGDSSASSEGDLSDKALAAVAAVTLLLSDRGAGARR